VDNISFRSAVDLPRPSMSGVIYNSLGRINEKPNQSVGLSRQTNIVEMQTPFVEKMS